MRVSQDFSAILNILASNLEPLLKVQLGQVLAARVLEILEGGQALLMLEGERILAEAEVPLQKGQEIFVQVSGNQQGKLILKILSDAEGEEKTIFPNQGVRMLNQANLPADEMGLAMVKGLIEYNLPVTPGNLRKLHTLIQIFQEKGPEILTAALKNMADEMPLTPAAVAITAINEGVATDKGEQTYKVLANLKAGLRELITQIPQGISSVTEEIPQQVRQDNLKSIINRILPSLENHIREGVRPTQIPQETLILLDKAIEAVNLSIQQAMAEGKLETAPQTSQIPMEIQVLKLLQAVKEVFTKDLIQQQGEPIGPQGALDQAKTRTEPSWFKDNSVTVNLLKELQKSLKDDSGDDFFIRPLNGKEEALSGLYKLLGSKPHPTGAVANQLQEVLNEPNRPEIKTLLDQVEQAVNHLEQPRESLEQAKTKLLGQGEMYYLPLPIKAENRTFLGDLFVYRRHGKNEHKPEQLYLALFLSTKHLGPLRIDLRVDGRQLGIAFLAESAKSVNIIQQDLDNLKTLIEEQGFQLSQMQCNLKVPPKLNMSEDSDAILPRTGLDLRV